MNVRLPNPVSDTWDRNWQRTFGPKPPKCKACGSETERVETDEEVRLVCRTCRAIYIAEHKSTVTD